MWGFDDLEPMLKWLFALACIGVVAIIAAGGWMLWFLVSHLAWVS